MAFGMPSSAGGLTFILIAVGLAILIFVSTRSAINRKIYRDRLKRIESGKAASAGRKPVRKSFWEILWGSPANDLYAKLKELEAQRKQRESGHRKPTLTIRLRQAGLGWSKSTYVLISLACAFVLFAGFVFWNFNPLAAAGFGLSLGLIVPHLYVTYLIKRRLKRFAREFANALDILVRGLRSGLPMIDCIRIAAKDTQEPIRSEFQKVIDDQALGTPTHEAILKMAERVPLSEVNFLAIVLKIQHKTGGSLSGALQTLSNTLRERRKLEGKIKTMSQEAKTSAGIIGSLPFFVAAALFFMNPEYLMLLVENMTGIFVLIGSGLWMLIGIAVMRKMLEFEV